MVKLSFVRNYYRDDNKASRVKVSVTTKTRSKLAPAPSS